MATFADMAQDRSWNFDLDGSGEPKSSETAGLEDGGAAEVTGQVTTGISLFALSMVAVGLIGIIGLLVVVTRSTADDLVAPPTTTAPTTTTIPVPSAAPSPLSVATTVPPTTLVPGQFLLGEPTGLWLFYGGTDPLQRLNLDNGEFVTFGLEAFPVEATGEDLVLYQGRSGVSGWVLASNPGEQALTWKRGPVAPGPEPGLLWALDREEGMEHPSGEPAGSGRWQLFDLAENRVLERRPGDLYDDVEAVLTGSEADRFRVAPDYSNRPDGIYRYGEDGYRRIADGQVLAADGSLLLVSDCTVLESADAEPGTCRSAWLDGETGGTFSDPIPARDVRSARFQSSGRWLITVDATGETSLIELESGAQTPLNNLAGAAVSPDGRWLAGLNAGELVIEDLLGLRETFRYELPDSDDGGTLLMVER